MSEIARQVVTLDDVIPLERLEARESRGDPDLPGIGRLFEIAGWGPVPRDLPTLRSWVVEESDLGSSLVMVIADRETDEILGLTILHPRPVWFYDRVIVGTRARARTLDPRLRRSARGVQAVDESDPLRMLSRATWPLLAERGWDISYALPNPSMLRRRQWRTVPPLNPGDSHTLGQGLRIDIDAVSPSSQMLDIRLAGSRGPEYDRLWETARKNLPIDCALLRSSDGLRQSQRTALPTIEVRRPRSDELIGYATMESTDKHMIDDILAIDEDAYHLVLRGLVTWLSSIPVDGRTDFITTLPHPAYRGAFDALGAYEIDWLYSVSLICGTGADLPLDASSWYVTCGD